MTMPFLRNCLITLFFLQILKNEQAYGYVNGTALHWYFDDDEPASTLTTVHKNFPEKFILYTEAS